MVKMATDWIQTLNDTEVRHVEPEIQPHSWYLPDRVGFSKWVTKTFKPLRDEPLVEPKGHVRLFTQQRFIRDYMQYKSPYRGILLYHGLGVGKTIASISAAEILMNQKEVVVMLPASLENNYINEIRANSHEYYTTKHHWVFVPLAELGDAVSKLQYVSKKMVKKNKGLWVPLAKKKKSNFDKLTEEQQKQIVNQINDTIRHRYTMLHYDGLQLTHINGLTEEGTVNPFDNKVVIVDEVHNLTSKLVGGAKIAPKLYKLLMEAENLKLILLSGTPMINQAHEIAYTMNLLKGYTKVYEMPYDIVEVAGAKKKKGVAKAGGLKADDVATLLEAHPKVNRVVNVNAEKKVVVVDLTPGAFEKPAATDSPMVAMPLDGRYMNDRDVLKNLKAYMLEKGVKLSLKFKTLMYTPLPTDKDAFNKLFIDEDRNAVKNHELFMRRILGSVSYYMNTDESLMPTIRKNERIELPMSDVQFMQYLEVRQDELRKESNQRKNARFQGAVDGGKTSTVYKAFSRALCNFTFPKEINRPYPSKIRQMMAEIDVLDDDKTAEDVKDADKPLDLDYEQLLQQALQSLKDEEETYLVRDLALYSPKMAALWDRLQETKGTALIYSQFRKVEGLGILGLMFQAHGFAEFKVAKDKDTLEWRVVMDEADKDKPKYVVFTSDKAMTDVILSVFNSDEAKMPASVKRDLERLYGDNAGGEWNLHGQICKILMITQSGAEGINLRNVRQVHILEPYWNQIRIDQVIGRAVRTKSHLALPEDERNVDVFMYLSKLTKKQIEESITLRKKDGGLTSDQDIARIAKRKSDITDGFLTLMKRASVDCKLNRLDKKHGFACYSYPIDMDEDSLGVKVDVLEEPLDDVIALRTETKELRPKKILIQNKAYIYVEATGEVYNFEDYASMSVLTFEGYLEKLPDGHWRWMKLKGE